MAYAYVCMRNSKNLTGKVLLQEYEEYRRDKATECNEMIPLQRLALEAHNGENREDGNRYHLLYHLELHQREGTTVAHETDTVGRYLTSIFEERQTPADKNDNVQRCIVRDELHLLKLEMSVPSECHEDIRYDKQ